MPVSSSVGKISLTLSDPQTERTPPQLRCHASTLPAGALTSEPWSGRVRRRVGMQLYIRRLTQLSHSLNEPAAGASAKIQP